MGTFIKGALIGLLVWLFRSSVRGFKAKLLAIQEENRFSKRLAFGLKVCALCLKCFEFIGKY